MHNTEEKKHHDPGLEPAVRSYERSRLAEQQKNEKPLSEKMTMVTREQLIEALEAVAESVDTGTAEPVRHHLHLLGEQAQHDEG